MSRKSANMPDCASCKHPYREHGMRGQCFRIISTEGKYTREEKVCPCDGYRSKEAL